VGVDGVIVYYVLTTQELAHMIQSAGIMFDTLQPGSFDMPFASTWGRSDFWNSVE